MFNVNQKIVCINDQFHPILAQYYPAFPKQGKIYTVRDIVPGINPGGGEGEVAIYLHEIHATINEHGIERGFNAERFAPLNPVQEKILEKKKVTEPETFPVN